MSWKEAIATHFPGAMLGEEFTKKVIDHLDGSEGFTPENTIFGNSTCPDEINRTVTRLQDHYGENFPMGGLAGYPFAGVSGFNAFAHHVPDMTEVKNLLILYGPHIGVSESGELGKIKRRGMKAETTACGSAVGAYQAIMSAWEKHMIDMPRFDGMDQQQYWIRTLLTAHMKKIVHSNDPMIEVLNTLWMSIDNGMDEIINSDRTQFGGKVALVGGVQINTPHGEKSYFLPKRFDIVDMRTMQRSNCLEQVKQV